MARIIEAIYKDENRDQLISISDITSGDYSEKFKGKLFCTTPNCSAQLSFVALPGNRSHFRTWRESPHTEQCLYYFVKTRERATNGRNGYEDGTVSQEQITRSLREAFELENMSDIERNKKQEKERNARKPKNRAKTTKGGNDSPAQRIVSDPNKINENMKNTGTRLYKRDVDALKDTDIGQTRTVTGKAKDIEFKDSYAAVIVEKNGVTVPVKFEEAFFSLNPQYQGLFHNIERFMKENDEVILNATGEVRKNKKSEEFEVIVFNGLGFLIHNRTLQTLAAEFAIRDSRNNR
ncbi:hypothetical protein [Fictibacillus sp. KU28468]|uniref:hypothetical protein n=1 Tax=Fictibacillus sp. KU28468 TaxID=2991053 RepID=UPI00223E3C22|nr:hypothetical protein [Fictibacillus sp. KU28468]UZJ78763.1 hypothetical protein OKX00_22070 [Fictibacillus sp. KU28468]